MLTTFRAPTVEYHLDRRAAALLRTDALALTESGVRPAEPEFYDRHWLDVELLPVGLRDFLHRFRMTESHAACALHGLPADGVAETVLALCALALGDPFGSASVQDGRMIQDLTPDSDERRDLRTVAGAHSDYLLLMAVADALVTLASVRELELDQETRKVLAQRRFTFEWGWAPVLFGDRLDPYLRLDHCQPGDPEAAKALSVLLSELDRVRHDVVVPAGSLLVVDNYRTAHGRRGPGRLKRISVSRNLRRTAGDGRHPRVLD